MKAEVKNLTNNNKDDLMLIHNNNYNIPGLTPARQLSQDKHEFPTISSKPYLDPEETKTTKATPQKGSSYNI